MDSIAQAHRVTRLILVPHTGLAYVPFAALVGKDGRSLIERWAIVTLPLASALPYLRRNPGGQPTAFSIFAPFPDELTGSLAEAQLVVREVGRSKSFVGRRGSERELRSALARDGSIHIASHALVNQANPMFSYVEVAGNKDGDPSNDGRLDVHELLRMNVKSDLVYLSGCETGAGAAWSTYFRRGQDYATLSQALLFAGAQNVVATLWRIDDAGASVFAGRFYRALQTRDVVDALAVAQRETLRDPRYKAPRYWAGYTISGSGLSKSLSQSGARAAVQ
jgi:CHAT domain-containing protein